MNTIRRLSIVVLALISTSAYAFDGDKCGKLFPKADGDHPPYYSPFYVSTMFPSTTSYLSSTGNCSMYDRESTKLSLIDNSMLMLQADAASGKGEYINALAELSGCPSDKYADVGRAFQKNYSAIFDKAEATSVLAQVNATMRSDSSLNKACVHISAAEPQSVVK